VSETPSANGSSFAPFFSRWRQVSLGGRVVVEGCVTQAHAAPSAGLSAAIARWNGYHYWQRRGADRWLLLVHESDRPSERWWLHLLLLLVTIITMAVAAASWTDADVSLATLGDAMRRGLPFALPMAAVLGAHELGHYFAARRYRVDVSPPWFLPLAPPALNGIGTLGAFVRLRSPIFDRRTLFDVAVAGPLAGLVVALPVLAFGLAHSAVVGDVRAAPFAHQFVGIDGRALFLGDSAAMWALRRALVGDVIVRLHPAAVAGWVGLFVTMLNLLPLTQFDGGHVAFAVFGRPQRWLAWGAVTALAALGASLWAGWWAWALLALLAGRGRLAHPRLVSAEASLDRGRLALGFISLVIFALCFAPIPAQWR
jgi:membrane-associated protease RseP (regulator of RpoE activity)